MDTLLPQKTRCGANREWAGIAELAEKREGFTMFKRVPRSKNTADAVGCVVVSIVLKNPKTGSHTRGNITRSFSLEDTRVSLVAERLEAALRG